MLKKAEALAAAGVLPGRLVAVLTDELLAHEDRVRMVPVAATQAETAERMAADITAFADRHHLDRVVVVNVSTTEPAASPHPAHGDLDALRRALAQTDPVLPAERARRLRRVHGRCAFVDFTPSTGARLPALAELAELQRVPFAGSDGKTGETLVKSVLAPMFAMRNLRVRSWSGTNLLGGGDGANLADPAANAAKVASKQRVLRRHARLRTRRAPPASTTSRTSATSRRPGTSSPSPASSAPACGWSSPGTAATRRWPHRWCSTWPGSPPPHTRPATSAPLTELGFFFKDPLGDGPAALGEQWTALATFVAGLGRRR